MSEEVLVKQIQKNHKKIVALTSKLVQIQSVNSNETEVAKHLADVLKREGIRCTLFGSDPKRQSLVATIGKGKRSFLLNGHLDTVATGDPKKWRHGPFSGKVVQGKLYGRGSYDMKGGVAAATYAFISLKQSGVKLGGQVKLVMNCDEESGYHKGIKEVLKKGIRADAAICCEPMSHQMLSVGAKGIYRFELITRGTTGHTAYRKGRINAVTKMAKLLVPLEKMRFAYKKHKMFSGPYVNPGTVIKGGEGINVFPETCSALVDCRLSFGQKEADVKRELRACMDKVCAKDPDLKYSIVPIGYVPTGLTNPDHAFVAMSREIIGETFGYEPSIGVTLGVTDGNFLMDKKIPTVIYGPTGKYAHTENEYVDVKSLGTAAESYGITAMRFLG